MSMTILSHELRALFADRILWVAGALLVCLSLYAAHAGTRAVDRQRAQISAAEEEESARYAEMRTTMAEIVVGAASVSPFADPTRPFVAGGPRGQRYAILPPAPLQATAVGQSDLIPAVVPVILEGADPRSAGEEIQNPVHLLTGPLDLAFVVTFLLPLLALALSFDLLSREREGGTLALLLSQPVSIRRVTLAKLLVRWRLLTFLMVGTATGALLAFGADVAFDRWVLWTGVVAAHTAFWVGLAGWVNATGRDSARNAVVLAFLWLAFVVLIPAGVQITAGLLYPVPSRAELVALEREEIRQVEEEAATVLAQYYSEHPELLPAGSVDAVDFQTRSFAVGEEVRQRLDPLQERVRIQLRSQQEFNRALRWLSPTMLTYESLVSLAGTGDRRVERFEAAVAAFHLEWLEFFAPLVYADERLTPADLLDRVPAWRFEDEDSGAVLALVVPGLAGLLVFLGLVLAMAFRLLRDGGERRWSP